MFVFSHHCSSHQIRAHGCWRLWHQPILPCLSMCVTSKLDEENHCSWFCMLGCTGALAFVWIPVPVSVGNWYAYLPCPPQPSWWYQRRRVSVTGFWALVWVPPPALYPSSETSPSRSAAVVVWGKLGEITAWDVPISVQVRLHGN